MEEENVPTVRETKAQGEREQERASVEMRRGWSAVTSITSATVKSEATPLSQPEKQNKEETEELMAMIDEESKAQQKNVSLST